MTFNAVEEALKLRSYGFAPIALHRPVLDAEGRVTGCNCFRGATCAPRSWGKHPINKGWQKSTHLFLDTEEIRHEFSTRHGLWGVNIGCATGPASALVVLDIDVGDEKPGLVELQKLEEIHGSLPATPTVITGSGGYHYYFQHPQGVDVRNSASKIASGVDVRGAGGQGVLPPSLHRSGHFYQWAPGRAPWDEPIAELPPTWIQLLVTPPKRPRPARQPHAPRATNLHPEMTLAQAKAVLATILEHPLVQWAHSFPEMVSREVWRGIATNLAIPAVDHDQLELFARNAFHAISSDYPAYSTTETDHVFDDALQSASDYGPITFAHMQSHGAPTQQCGSYGGSSLVHAARRTLIWSPT